MKKIVAGVCVLFITIAVNAQKQNSLTLNAYGSYTFQDRVNFDAAYTKVKEGFQYGGGLEYFLSRARSVELKYLRMDTHFPLYRANGNQLNTNKDKGALNYILIGGNSYFESSRDAKVLPFIGGDLGVGIVEGESSTSNAKFAWDFKAGIKLATSSAISIKLHAYIQSIISTFGTDYWYYAGAAFAVPDYATIFQFGLGGALCFDFHKK